MSRLQFAWIRCRVWLAVAVALVLAVLALSIIHLEPESDEGNFGLRFAPKSERPWLAVELAIRVLGSFPGQVIVESTWVKWDPPGELPAWWNSQTNCQAMLITEVRFPGTSTVWAGATQGSPKGTEDCLVGLLDQNIEAVVAQVPSKIDYFFFPFDHLAVVVKPYLTGIPGGGRESLATSIRRVEAQNWTVDVQGSESGMNRLVLRRSTPLRVIALLLLVGFILATPLVLLAETVGSAAEVAIAIGVGLWTARAALVPGQPRSFLAVDFLTLAISAVLIGALCLSALLHVAERWDAGPRSNRGTSWVGRRESNVFHKINCRHVSPPAEDLVIFRSLEEIRQSQRRPCRTCCSGMDLT